jgi:hypothetical protein
MDTLPHRETYTVNLYPNGFLYCCKKNWNLAVSKLKYKPLHDDYLHLNLCLHSSYLVGGI